MTLDEHIPAGPVWALTCPCGWSRLIPRSTPAARRRQILAAHQAEKHPDKQGNGAE